MHPFIPARFGEPSHRNNSALMWASERIHKPKYQAGFIFVTVFPGTENAESVELAEVNKAEAIISPFSLLLGMPYVLS